MAKLLTGQYNSGRGKTYLVEIYDITTGSDSSDEFDVTERPILSYSGGQRNLFQKIKPLSVTLGMNVTSGSPEETFVNSFVAETDEHRFWVKITRDGTEMMRGWLQIDQSSIPIRHQSHFPFTIRATDSLGQIGNYDYIDPDTPDTPYDGIESVKDHLIKLIKSANVHELYGASDPFLSISTSFHCSLMPNNTDDYTARIFFDHRKFASEVEQTYKEIEFDNPLFPTIKLPQGIKPTEPGNAKSTLEEFCFLFNAVLFHANGKYYFVSRARLLGGPSINFWTYDQSGNELTEATESLAMTIGSIKVNNTGYYIHNGKYSFLPPIKELVIEHHKGGGNNKIQGAEWIIGNHAEVCFDEINNQGNAILVARFNFSSSIKYTTGTNESWFRMVMGIKIKVGSYYLIREIETGLDIFGNGNDTPLPTQEIPYEDAEWSLTEGYYKVVLDRLSADGHTSEGNKTIIDIESPPIPETGQLCIDVDMVQDGGDYLLRKFDPTITIFDDRWDEVTFTAENSFNLSGNVWEILWEVYDNYLNIQSDDGELNEDTLAFTRYTATVNARNSEKLTFETGLGDDVGSNTHGRIQIDKSVANDGSDLEDADGGWKLNGIGTEYDHILKLLAWDMARLRVGLVYIMRATLRTTNDPFYPHGLITFDSKVFVMGDANGNTANEEYNGDFYSIADVDSSKITIKAKAYSQAVGQDPREDPTLDDDDDPPFVFAIDGITTDYIEVPEGYPLPDTSILDANSINAAFEKALRGTANLKYRDPRTYPGHFGIDNTLNRILLERNAKATDEYFFKWRNKL